MAAVRALAALLVLVAAGAALADDVPPLDETARVVSRVRQQKPAHGTGVDSLQRSAPLSFTYEPLDWYSDWLRPIKPEAGKKQKTIIYVINLGDKPVPAGTLLSIWANKTERAKCGETGDVDYKLPELLPLQTKTIKASWKVPTTLGEARVRFFLDSACTVFNESADYVQWSYRTTVVEAGTKYAHLELAEFKPETWWEFDIEPKYPVINGTLKANLAVTNLGTEASEAGVKMAVYYDDSYYDVNITECTHMGQKTVDLPKIGPGKTKVIPVDGLKVSSSSYGEVNVVLDASCMLAPVPVDAYWESPYYLAVEKAGALLGGVQPKGQIYFTVKTSPKKPKVNDTMTVKVKIINMGGADGSVGRVEIFTSSVDDSYGGYYGGERCDPTGFVHSFNTTDLVIKAGKSKMVKITDVPAPGKAGWFGLTVVPDANCLNEAEKDATWQPMPFSAFEVVP